MSNAKFTKAAPAEQVFRLRREESGSHTGAQNAEGNRKCRKGHMRISVSSLSFRHPQTIAFWKTEPLEPFSLFAFASLRVFPYSHCFSAFQLEQPDRAVKISSAIRRKASRGEGAPVIGRPMTRKSAPSRIASPGVNTRC